jgi:hypothetical protein
MQVQNNAWAEIITIVNKAIVEFFIV